MNCLVFSWPVWVVLQCTLLCSQSAGQPVSQPSSQPASQPAQDKSEPLGCFLACVVSDGSVSKLNGHAPCVQSIELVHTTYFQGRCWLTHVNSKALTANHCCIVRECDQQSPVFQPCHRPAFVIYACAHSSTGIRAKVCMLEQRPVHEKTYRSEPVLKKGCKTH